MKGFIVGSLALTSASIVICTGLGIGSLFPELTPFFFWGSLASGFAFLISVVMCVLYESPRRYQNGDSGGTI